MAYRSSAPSSWLILGDCHLGEFPLTPEKVRAYYRLLTLATKKGLKVASVGDFLEMTDITSGKNIKAATDKIAEAFRQYQAATRQAIVMVNGNHDRYANTLHFKEFIPDVSFEIHKPFFYDSASRLLIHHGDLADVTTHPLQQHLGRYQGKGLVDAGKFVSDDEQYNADRLVFHQGNMIDLWADMRTWVRRTRGLVDNAVQQRSHNSWYTRALHHAAINHLTQNREWGSKVAVQLMHYGPLMSLAMRLAENEITFNMWLAKQMPNEGLIVQGHTHVPALWGNKDTEGRKTVFSNAGSTYSSARYPTVVIWDPTSNTSTLYGYFDEQWQPINEIHLGTAEIFIPGSTPTEKPRQFIMPKDYKQKRKSPESKAPHAL